MTYRSRTEITSQILETASDGVAKTKIMYRSFLTHAQMKDYLEVLLANGLVMFDQNHIFKTTDKGMRFLRIYTELDKLAPRISGP